MLGNVTAFFTGCLEEQDSKMKGAVMYPGSGQNALEDAARTIPGKGMLSLAKHAIKFQATLCPSNGHMAKKLVAHDKLPEDSVWSSHVFITSNGEDIRSRDWPAKPIVAEPGFFGVPPLLPVCGCLHWNVSML